MCTVNARYQALRLRARLTAGKACEASCEASGEAEHVRLCRITVGLHEAISRYTEILSSGCLSIYIERNPP